MSRINNYGMDFSPEEFTPLASACWYGDLHTVQSLLSNGCDPFEENFKGLSPLHFCCMQNRSFPVLLHFLRHPTIHYDLSMVDWAEGKTALMYASSFGVYKSAELLLEMRADVNQQDFSGQSALFYAAKGCHLSIIKLLLTQKACLNLRDNKNANLLHHLLRSSQASSACLSLTLKYLVDGMGIQINVKMMDGTTPLHVACERSGFHDMVKYLIQKGADKEAKKNHFETPLWSHLLRSVEPISKDMIMTLYKAGVNFQQKNFLNQTPSEYCKEMMKIDSKKFEGLNEALKAIHSIERLKKFNTRKANQEEIFKHLDESSNKQVTLKTNSSSVVKFNSPPESPPPVPPSDYEVTPDDIYQTVLMDKILDDDDDDDNMEEEIVPICILPNPGCPEQTEEIELSDIEDTMPEIACSESNKVCKNRSNSSSSSDSSCISISSNSSSDDSSKLQDMPKPKVAEEDQAKNGKKDTDTEICIVGVNSPTKEENCSQSSSSITTDSKSSSSTGSGSSSSSSSSSGSSSSSTSSSKSKSNSSSSTSSSSKSSHVSNSSGEENVMINASKDNEEVDSQIYVDEDDDESEESSVDSNRSCNFASETNEEENNALVDPLTSPSPEYDPTSQYKLTIKQEIYEMPSSEEDDPDMMYVRNLGFDVNQYTAKPYPQKLDEIEFDSKQFNLKDEPNFVDYGNFALGNYNTADTDSGANNVEEKYTVPESVEPPPKRPRGRPRKKEPTAMDSSVDVTLDEKGSFVAVQSGEYVRRSLRQRQKQDQAALNSPQPPQVSSTRRRFKRTKRARAVHGPIHLVDLTEDD